jgi:hypothetical protein
MWNRKINARGPWNKNLVIMEQKFRQIGTKLHQLQRNYEYIWNTILATKDHGRQIYFLGNKKWKTWNKIMSTGGTQNFKPRTMEHNFG